MFHRSYQVSVFELMSSDLWGEIRIIRIFKIAVLYVFLKMKIKYGMLNYVLRTKLQPSWLQYLQQTEAHHTPNGG